MVSVFRDFIREFPLRCSDVLSKVFPLAEKHDREVTLLLMTTAAAFVIPYERLRCDKHPTGDSQQYKEAVSTLASMLGKPFLDGSFWPKEPASWKMGESETVTGHPDSWPTFSTRKEPNKKTPASQIFATLRNALSHGNIYICGPPDQITEIVFAAEKRCTGCGSITGYKFLCVTPHDLHQFLKGWFKYVKKQKLPQNAVTIALEDENITSPMTVLAGAYYSRA